MTFNIPCHYDALPYPVIQSGSKNAVWESREAEQWNRAKDLLLWWHLTVSLTTAADSLLSLWAMSFGLRHHAVFCSPLIMTRFPKIVILNGGKNALWEKRKTERWNGVKNLLCWWCLTDFPHYGNRSFAAAQDDALPSYTRIMESAVRRSCWRT